MGKYSLLFKGIGKLKGYYNKNKYYKTINSQVWKDFKWEVIKENQVINKLQYGYFKCVWCKKIKPIKESNLHHTSYKHGLYNKKYLRLICKRCHHWWHYERK